jgi:hyperosmotically inducible protein
MHEQRMCRPKQGDNMRNRFYALAAAIALCGNATVSGAAERKDLQVLNDISKAVNQYVHFTIFDDVNAQLNGGVVTLTGRVTMPYKRGDIEKRVAKIDGVQQVRDQITVLPVSQFDDQLRVGIARAIYRNSNLSSYALGPNPSIHVIVERGHVTLTGVVRSDVDRAVARSVASGFNAFSVTVDLKTEAEVREELEKIA